MSRYCLECDTPLPNIYPWTIGNEDGLYIECDDKRWRSDEDDEDDEERDCDE